MTTTTPFAAAAGAPLREVSDVPARPSRTASVVAVLVALLVLLPLTAVVPPATVAVGAALWVVLRIGVRVR